MIPWSLETAAASGIFKLFIADNAPERIYTIAAGMGVVDFVIPGNKVEFVAKYRKLLEDLMGADNVDFFAPGFIAQGGKITDFAKAAGRVWIAIVGRAIYEAENIREAALEIAACLA